MTRGKKSDEFFLGPADHLAVRALRANYGWKSEQIEARMFGHCVLLLLLMLLLLR